MKRFLLGLSAVLMTMSVAVAPLSTATLAATQSAPVSIEGDVKVANINKKDQSYSDSINANVDEVVEVKVWYHNRENHDSGKIAENLRVAVTNDGKAGKSQTITGTIKADNSNTVVDTAKINLSLDHANLEYIAGSAKRHYNKGAYEGRTVCQTGAQEVPANDPNKCYAIANVNDAVYSAAGTKVVDKFRPCYAYEESVTLQMRVKASGLKVNKYVSMNDGDRDMKNNKWDIKNQAKPSDTMDYMIRFENKGNTTLKNVVVADNLPDYMTYVAGSSYIVNGNHPSGKSLGTDNVYKGGVNVGDMAPGAVGYVIFSVKISDKTKFAKCGVYTLKNVAGVKPDGVTGVYNTAHTDVTIVCAPGETPKTPETPEVPSELPSTGPAAAIGSLVGVSALGYGVTSFLNSRRNLRRAFRG